MRFERKLFFGGWRQEFGRLHQDTVDALEMFLSAMEHDRKLLRIPEAAYLLATTYWETAHTMRPIEEYGRGQGHSYGTPDPTTFQRYYGRGFVQLTWRRNYETWTQELRDRGFRSADLIHHPEQALIPEYAYLILAEGMRNGDFGGGGLGRYVDQTPPDYLGARATVNGSDHAEDIARLAEQFETIVSRSVVKV